MKSYNNLLFPIYLIAMGVITLSGVNLFGSAILEGAAWKQNVIIALMIIFGMLPPFIRGQKATWMVAGYAIAFFMFGGANIIGTVGIMLGLEKIILAVVMLFMAYRLYSETWTVNKWFMLVPVCGVIFVALLFPIQDQNIVGSGFDALKNWSSSDFTSDKGFHIYLGLLSIAAGITEILIQTKSSISKNPVSVIASEDTID
ncbi:MAG: hypothetical protein K2H96_10815 [Muribaculaceae bacterium]|nr:hypothetical protein [Muribaculaceae bacterium]